MMLRSYILILLLLICGIVSAQSIQELISSKDLSGFKVENLSDEDINKYKAYIQNMGVSETQAEQLAIQRGLPSAEILKLKVRLSNISTSKYSQTSSNFSNKRFDSTTVFKPSKSIETKSDIFGSDLFNNPNSNFDAPINIPTPKNYIIGTNDELAIDVYGYQETNPRLTVSPEGSINISNVGIVPVNGLTIEQATKRISDKMSKNGYASIGTGKSKIIVSISKIRTIKITVTGEAKRPGTYSVSSLSNLFNALYQAGGPNDRGSLRNIQLIRNNKVITVLDAYDFLLYGFQKNNIRLEDLDVIRIPIAATLVKLRGEVKREGTYEILPRETIANLFEFAGGFSKKAYTASVNVIQFTDKEKKIKDISKDEFGSYLLHNGEEISVGKILDRFNNRIVINGAVYRPGEYELIPKMKLSQLIKKADGLKDDALLERALLFRVNEDLSKQVIAFNINNILSVNTDDIELIKDDSVSIASINDFNEAYTLTIDGEIKKPGIYEYYKGITLKDLFFQAGGFTDAANTKHIEIARRVKSDSSNDSVIAEVIDISTENDLNIKSNEIQLKPWDIIIVRTNLGYKTQQTIKLEGEVVLPGTYILVNKNEKVSDVIKRAGGLTDEADITGGSIIRINTSKITENAIETFNKFNKYKDSSLLAYNDINKPTVKIGLQLDKILETNSDGLDDITLLEGDIINIPKKRNVVKVNGEVMFPTEVVFKEGASFDYYIGKAGGFTESARKRKIFVLSSNGSAAKTKTILFFKKYPKILAGSEIIIPRVSDIQRKGLSTAEWLAVASGMASLAGVAVAIINVSKR